MNLAVALSLSTNNSEPIRTDIQTPWPTARLLDISLNLSFFTSNPFYYAYDYTLRFRASSMILGFDSFSLMSWSL